MGVADAQTDATHVFSGTDGEVSVEISVEPPQPRLGTVVFYVTPSYPETLGDTSQAEIRLVADDPDGVRQYQSPGLNNPGSPNTYIGRIAFSRPGSWSIDAEITPPNGSMSIFTFDLEIEDVTVRPGPEGGIVFFVLTVVVFTGGAIVMYLANRRRRRA